MNKKVLFVLVDPSAVNMNDVINIHIPKELKFDHVSILRVRLAYYGKYKPIEVFFVDEPTEKFDSLEDLKKYFEEFELKQEESKNG